MNNLPTPKTCSTCTADERLKKIEDQLTLILKIIDTMAKSIQELMLKKRK